MVDGISILGVLDVSLSVFVLLFMFLLLVMGRIVPRRYYDEVKSDRDYFKEANKIKNEALGKYEERFVSIIEIADNTNKLVKTLLPSNEEDTNGSA